MQLKFLEKIKMHCVKVTETGFEVFNFDKLIIHQFSAKISQIFNDDV